MSLEVGSLKFLEFYLSWNVNLDDLSRKKTTFLTLDTSGKKNELLKEKTAFFSEKFLTTASFFESLNLEEIIFDQFKNSLLHKVMKKQGHRLYLKNL